LAKKLKRMWSMKTDRELIELAKTKSLQTLVEHFRRTPESILRKAKRLGLSISRSAARHHTHPGTRKTEPTQVLAVVFQ
jgi:hypothetical protein